MHDEPPPKPGGKLLLIGGILLGLGLLTIALSVFLGYRAVSSVTQGMIEVAAPGTMTVPAEQGEFVKLYVAEGGTARPTVAVSGPDGSAVAVEDSGEGYLEVNGRRFDSLAHFTAPAAGDYAVTADVPAGESATVTAGPDMIGLIEGMFGGLAGGCVGGVLCVAGVVVLIIGLVKRFG